MTVAQFIQQSYLKARGKISALTPTDNDYQKLLALGNYYKNAWANEVGVNWVTLYNIVDTGTVTASNTFDLDETINSISGERGDSVRIIYTDNTNFSDWDIVAPERLKYYRTGNYVAQIGQTLVFNKTFKTSDPEFGGTIQVPAYTIPDDLVNAGDEIPIDIPEWLSTICAAEYVRNDLVYQNQYPNLIAEANELMKKMIENNNPQVTTATLKPAAIGRTW